MVEIAPQTYDKLEKLFDAQGPQSARGALVTEKGGVYSSHSLVGRFLQLVGVAKPVQVQDLERFFSDKLRSLHMGAAGAWAPNTAREGAGGSRLSGDAFQQFKLNTVEPHNVRMRKTFNESVSKIKTLTESLDAHVTEYHKLIRQGKNPVRAERSIRQLSESLDTQVDNLLKAGKGIFGKSEERPEMPSKLLLDATIARWVTSEVLDYRGSAEERRIYADDFASAGRPLANAADFEPGKIREAAHEIIDSCDQKGTQQAKEEDQAEQARWRQQHKNWEEPGDGFHWHRHAGDPGAGSSSGPRFHNSQSVGGKPGEFNQKIASAMLTLGLDPSKTDYTERDINVAYKKASLESHPDKVTGRLSDAATADEAAAVSRDATEKFKAVNQAHQDLLDVAEWYFRSK